MTDTLVEKVDELEHYKEYGNDLGVEVSDSVMADKRANIAWR